jgi:hypothetical protein
VKTSPGVPLNWTRATGQRFGFGLAVFTPGGSGM